MKKIIAFKWSLVLLLVVLALLVSACGATEEPAAEVQPTAAEVAQPTEAAVEEPTQASTEEEGCTVFFFAPQELSGSGATVGNNFKDAASIAIDEINAEGGLLGCQIEVEWADTQSDPATSKALIAKGLEQDPYIILGPGYSGSIIVNMVEAQRAETTQIVGGEAANLTQQGNPYIFRTSFGQATSMPKIAEYMVSEGIGSVDVVYVNNDFGKGGRDAIIAQLEERGIEILNDISTEEQQADFAPEVLTVKGSEADALFVYLNEEESARLLVELKNQGFDKPVIGETTIIGQNVIDLAGDAANGAMGHVGLTASAPLPLVEEYRQKFEDRYGRTPDHNGMKGYIGVYVVKAITERIGEFDSKKLAEELHCTTITTDEEPGVLMDVVYDENGDLDRESFLVEVVDGEQVVTKVLPRLGGSCGEEGGAAPVEEEPQEACTVFFFAPQELSGSGATVGNNFKDAASIAIDEINAEGGLLGCQIEVEWADTQSDPATSKALIAKGLEQDPYIILGPGYSGSIIVNMVEAQRAETTQIVGGEAANLTQQGNPYIFRTSFGQATSMPKIAEYMVSEGIGSVDVVYVNNDFGKGGRDAIIAQLQERGIEILNDISTEEQQADFAPEVLTVKGSEADALFVYLNEEESARLLVELKNQGFDKPVIGETTIIGQNVIDLAGDAANGAKGHVGLTASAPLPLVEEYRQKFEDRYGRTPDHNGMKGYLGVYVVKAITERIGEFDSKKLAEELHCTIITTDEEPGVLMDVVYDENGDLDRESFLVEVIDGEQVVTQVLPRLGNTCGEP